MPTPVDGNQPVDSGQSSGAESLDDYMGDDFGSGDVSQTSKSGTSTGTRSTYGSQGSTPTYGATAPKASSTGTLSGAGDFGAPVGDAEIQGAVQQLAQQGYSSQEIKNLIQQQYGVTITDVDIQYAQDGLLGGNNRGYTKYLGNYGPMGPLSRNYGSPYFQQYMNQLSMVQEAKDDARAAERSNKQQMVKMHIIMLQIMMGDIVGAIRSFAVLMSRDGKDFTRQMLKKLGKVRQARSRVIRNFANNRPPRAYAGDNPQSAARAQDQAQKYTQFVQLSTQLMGELGDTAREITDGIATTRRDEDNFWQAYASMRDNEFRTNERVMSVR